MLMAPHGRDFSAVLMDICMPVMNGHECTRAFRAWEAAQRQAGLAAAPMRLPIVAFTANNLEEAYAASLAAGLDSVATKPLRQEETVAALRSRAVEFATHSQRKQ